MSKSKVTKVKKEDYECSIADTPTFEYYVKIAVQKNGLNWKQTAFIAWLTVPSHLRNPRTMGELADQIGVTRKTLSTWQHADGKTKDAIHEMLTAPYIERAEKVLNAFWSTAEMTGHRYYQHHKLALQMAEIIDRDGNPADKKSEDDAQGEETLVIWKSRQKVNVSKAEDTLEMFEELMSE